MINLDELERLEQEATPEPWSASQDEPFDVVLWGPNEDEFVANVGGSRVVNTQVAFDIDQRNGNFLAKLRNAAPDLLKAARERDELRVDLNNARDGWEACAGAGRKLEEQLEGEISALRTRVAELESENANLNGAVKLFEQGGERQARDSQKQRERIAALETQLAAASAERDEWKASAELAGKQLSEIGQTIAAAKAENERLKGHERTVSSLAYMLGWRGSPPPRETLELDIRARRAAYEELTSKLTTATAEVERLRGLLELALNRITYRERRENPPGIESELVGRIRSALAASAGGQGKEGEE